VGILSNLYSTFFRRTATPPGEPSWLRARYDAAQTTDQNKEHWSLADGLSADTANSPSIRSVLRKRARYEYDNNPLLKGIVRTHVNAVIGTGPRLQVLTDDEKLNTAVESRWKLHAESDGLAEKLRTMRRSECVDGEAFALIVTGEDGRLSLLPVEADQFTTPYLHPYNNNHVDGIELSITTRTPLRYHMLRIHPGDYMRGPTLDTETVDACSVIHTFWAERAGQHRGIPQVMTSLEPLSIHRRYTLAVLLSMETVANIALFLKTTSAAVASAIIDPWKTFKLRRNAVMTLPEGTDISAPKQEQPTSSFADVRKSQISDAGRALNMPYNVAGADSSGHNFSSGKLDHQVYGKEVEIDQHRYGRVVVNKYFRQWLLEEVVYGYLPVEAMQADRLHEWQWDPLEDIDPQKTVAANVEALQYGLTSLQTLYARQGQDWRTECAKNAKAFGLSFEDYMARVAAQIWPTAPIPPVASSSPTGEFGDISRLQWKRNLKAIQDVLMGVIEGTMTDVLAVESLQTLGLPPDRAQRLIDDAHDGRIDDPEVMDAPLVARLCKQVRAGKARKLLVA